VAILDLPNLLVNGILVLEWAERIKSNLPEENLWIQMRWIAEERRNLTIIPQGETYQELAKKLEILVFGAF
jgi:tRNA A37 threonylcarbamoyladenosine biosynthesis protein TsaE